MFDVTYLIIMLLVASLVVSLVTMVLVIVALNRISSRQAVKTQSPIAPSARINGNGVVQGVVFCRNCGNQYDSTLNACPSCKTAR